jgi:hypothetical protein
MGRVEWSIVIACACALACHDGNGNGDAAPAVSIAKVTFSAPPGSNTVTPEHHPATVCRAIGASGPIRHDNDAGAILPNDVVGDDFAELGAGGKLSVKNGTTSREMIFEGPGEVRVCVGGDEEMWMTSGVYSSVIGAGESPGSEVWIVTPHAVVRYGSGVHMKMNVTNTKLDVDLKAGDAWAFPIDGFLTHDAGAPREVDGWVEIPGNAPLTFISKRAPSQLVGDCERAATAARDLAIEIGSHDASLSDLAPKHVVARQKAHAVCSAAELVAARSLDLVERERLLPRARAASAKWRDNSAKP